jgi:hypothetical protein
MAVDGIEDLMVGRVPGKCNLSLILVDTTHQTATSRLTVHMGDLPQGLPMSPEEQGWFDRAVAEAKALFKRRRPLQPDDDNGAA